MLLDVQLDQTLDEAWRIRARRQVDFKFAALRDDIRTLTVILESLDGTVSPQAVECRMKAVLRGGDAHEVVMKGMPNICIADAASRLARTVGRALAQAPQGRRVARPA